MAIIQIPRLRSQINALAIHYDDSKVFVSALGSFFNIYGRNKSIADLYKNEEQTTLLTYDITDVVFTELESSFKKIAKFHPRQAVETADLLWQEPIFESKKLAIILVSNLGNDYSDTYIQRIEQWIHDGLEEKIFNEILNTSDQIPFLIANDKWQGLINNWLNSDSRQMIRNGLKALGQLINKKEFQNLPYIFGVILPIFCQPELSIQKDLMTITKLLIKKNQPEAASFLISIGEIYPSKDVSAFIRKCLPLFDEFFQQELRLAANK